MERENELLHPDGQAVPHPECFPCEACGIHSHAVESKVDSHATQACHPRSDLVEEARGSVSRGVDFCVCACEADKAVRDGVDSGGVGAEDVDVLSGHGEKDIPRAHNRVGGGNDCGQRGPPLFKRDAQLARKRARLFPCLGARLEHQPFVLGRREKRSQRVSRHVVRKRHHVVVRRNHIHGRELGKVRQTCQTCRTCQTLLLLLLSHLRLWLLLLSHLWLLLSGGDFHCGKVKVDAVVVMSAIDNDKP